MLSLSYEVENIPNVHSVNLENERKWMGFHPCVAELREKCVEIQRAAV